MMRLSPFLKLRLQTIGLLLALGFSTNPTLAATNAEPESAPVVRLLDVPVSVVLNHYKDLSGMELIVSSNVDRASRTITMETNGSLTVSPAEILEKALLEHAGVIVTRLDNKRASVTFNEALVNSSVSTAATVNTVEDTEGTPFLIFIVIMIGVIGAAFAFWVWMIVDCASNETERIPRVAWMLAIVFAGFICAPLYFVARKLPR